MIIYLLFLKFQIFLRHFGILTSGISRHFTTILHMGQFSDIYSEILQKIKIKVGGPCVLWSFSNMEGLFKRTSIRYGNTTRIG